MLVRLYAGEIIMGRITEDNVPAKLKARVHKYLVDMGYFDDVEVKRALECEKAMISYLKSNCGDVMNTMESTADLSADTEKALAAGIQAFKSSWV